MGEVDIPYPVPPLVTRTSAEELDPSLASSRTSSFDHPLHLRVGPTLLYLNDMTISTLLALSLTSVIIGRLSKLSPHYRKGLLLGYQERMHNYRIWDGNKVIITHDVIFPIISREDVQNSGDDTFSARIDLSKCHKDRTIWITSPPIFSLIASKLQPGKCHGATSSNKEPVVSDVYGRLSPNSLSEDQMNLGGDRMT
jgi:hypothetical protein